MVPGAVQVVAGEALKTANGQSISNGIWTLVGIAITGCVALATAWWRWGPVWRKTEQDGDALIRSELRMQVEQIRDELSELKVSNEDKGRRLGTAEFKINDLTQELGQHRFLMGLVLDELERVSSGNVIASQVRRRLDEMQRRYRESSPAEEVGALTEEMAKLCKVPGVGEEKSGD